MGSVTRLLGRLGRRYWLDRIDRALHRAHEQGLIDSWTLHEIDYRIKYSARPDAGYPLRPAIAKATGPADGKERRDG